MGYLEILPEDEQLFAYEFVKRMVLAWDSDFTKCTKEELKAIEEAEMEFQCGETYTEEEALEILGIDLSDLT